MQSLGRLLNRGGFMVLFQELRNGAPTWSNQQHTWMPWMPLIKTYKNLVGRVNFFAVNTTHNTITTLEGTSTIPAFGRWFYHSRLIQATDFHGLCKIVCKKSRVSSLLWIRHRMTWSPDPSLIKWSKHINLNETLLRRGTTRAWLWRNPQAFGVPRTKRAPVPNGCPWNDPR